MMRPLHSIPLPAIRAARNRVAGAAIHTPLLRLDRGDGPELYLKLENLQPIGSFKLRGATNALELATPEELENGVYTASAGNMAQGLAWSARRLGIPCRIVVPDHAPEIKLRAIERLGGEVVKVPFDAWWKVLEEHEHPGMEGLFIHPVADPAVIAGNGTIALEILDDLPEVDAVIAPFGAGGLSCGIASAFRFLKPDVEVFACEVETAAPLAASFDAGEPTEFEYRASFVDGIGGKNVLPAMWPLARKLLAGSVVVTLDEVADAVRILVEHARVVAEGAGAASVAAGLRGAPGEGGKAFEKVVCVVSGGNIDASVLTEILSGGVPGS